MYYGLGWSKVYRGRKSNLIGKIVGLDEDVIRVGVNLERVMEE